MEAKQEILEAIEILIKSALKNTTKIYTCIVKDSSGGRCTVLLNGDEYIVKFYGDTPTVNLTYPLFVPQGNLSLAFVITS